MEQQYDESFEITTIVNVERFFRHVIGILGKGFHPDTDFNDYVESTREVNEFDDHSEVTSTFTQEVGDRYNKLLEQAFCVCEIADVDIYDVALTLS